MHHLGQIFSYIRMKKNTYHHYFLLIKSRQDISTEQNPSYDDLSGTNDGEEIGRSICDVYPKELELKVGHQMIMLRF